MGWLTDAGYRVAMLTIEEPGHWQIWGSRTVYDRDSSMVDMQSFSPLILKHILQVSGDFVVRGNLELFDANSWRELGKFLAQVKKNKGMGRPLGLVAGRQKGAKVRRKKVLRGMRWQEIQIIVAEQPQIYNRLHNEYANHETEQYRKEFKQTNHGQEQPPGELRRVRKNAIQNFARYVKKPVPPVLD